MDRFPNRSDDVAGQLLLVTQVSGTDSPVRLAAKLFYTTGSEWLELKAGSDPEALTFDKVWGRCAAHNAGNNTDVALVSEFMQRAGEATKHVSERVGVWAQSGLGVTKRNFFKVKVRTGSGARDRWAASKKTLHKVWPVLRTRFSKGRRR